MKQSISPVFAPQLFIPHQVTDIDFYLKTFDAVELRRFSNEDGSIHVSELSINGILFHLHEEVNRKSQYCPDSINATTVLVGLFVEDVDAIMEKAVAAGATVNSPAQDYDYGYRQGQFRDPFGHQWLIEKKI